MFARSRDWTTFLLLLKTLLRPPFLTLSAFETVCFAL